MRSGALAVVLAWSHAAVAQPAPAPYGQPPPAPYGQPPPLAGYPGQPTPPPPPVERSSWTWSFGFGVGTLAFDDGDGPCPSCNHGAMAAGIELSVGYRLLPGVSPFAFLDVGLTTASGLGTDGEGGSLQMVSIFGGLTIDVGDRLRVLGGLGYGTLGYSWEESSSSIFGTTSVDREMEIGTGPGGLAGARYHLGRTGKLDYGVEGRLTVVRLREVGETSLFTVGVVGGWL